MSKFHALFITLALSHSLAYADTTHKSFAEKHPKLHYIGRKIRKTCQVMTPIVNVAGSCAQILSYARR